MRASKVIRNLGGKWVYPKPDAISKLGAGPFVELPGGVVINPLVKVQSIYEDGLEHSVVRFYAFTEATIRGVKK